ncbi:MAG: preprotein translocase subunit YajC [Acidaminococcales bacterium]|jgi:preprotein translocase subunit YajC|nr:preprotein translocase subunit YajC [Acidaminococcales bacterium]
MESFLQDPALFNIGIILFMCVMFYFLIIRPQKKEERKREMFQNSLKKGDKVVTAGGIFGVITAMSEQKITLRAAEKVEIDFSRSAIVRFQDLTKQELAENEMKDKK